MAAVDDLITENIDIWTSAVKRKSSAGRGGGKKIELYGVKKLRELILDLAVRGLLVEQDPDDEPAGVLLERIAAEKAELVKAKQIKKPKALPSIKEEGKPFELPVGWNFVRLNELSSLITKGSSPKWQGVEYTDDPSQVLFVTSENVGAGELLLEKKKYVELEFNEIQPRSVLQAGDFLMNIVGASIGRTATFNIQAIANINQAVCLIRLHNSLTNSKYLQIFFNSETCKRYMFDNQVDNARANLSMGNIAKFVIPLPPEEEQHRIVAKVDELMALCDQLEQQTESSITAHQTLMQTLLSALTREAATQPNKAHATDAPTPFTHAWNRLAEHFDTVFTTEDSIEQLKQTILQLAVMGKLVPQDPSDEPASELLERIAAEKAELVKAKKIKKQKALPEIGEEEMLFVLPKGWCFTRLGNVHDVSSSKRIHVQDYVEDGVPFFRSKEIGELGRGSEVSTELFISREQYERLKGMLGFPNQKDLMLASIGGSIGNNWISDKREFYYKDGNITKIGWHKFANIEYLKIFIDSNLFWKQVTGGVSGSAYNALTIIKIKSMVYAVPPLEEQGRIVAKVKDLMFLCEQLGGRLESAQDIQFRIAAAVTEQFSQS